MIFGILNIFNFLIPPLCFVGFMVWNYLTMTNNTEEFKGKLQQQAAVLQDKLGKTKTSLTDRLSGDSKTSLTDRLSNNSKDAASDAASDTPAARKRFCGKCGAPCNGQAKFCPKCGAAIGR